MEFIKGRSKRTIWINSFRKNISGEMVNSPSSYAFGKRFINIIQNRGTSVYFIMIFTNVISQILLFVHANTMKMFEWKKNYNARNNMFKSTSCLFAWLSQLLTIYEIHLNFSLCILSVNLYTIYLFCMTKCINLRRGTSKLSEIIPNHIDLFNNLHVRSK